MFTNRKPQGEAKLPANLTPREKKQVRDIIEKNRREGKLPNTAQLSIPFDRMFPDGICRVRENYYTKTIRFSDINYQLAQQEEQGAIFEGWCSFLNFFDSSIHFELTFLNMAADQEEVLKSVRISPKKDGFNDIRAEYSRMLKSQLEKGNNGIAHTKYLTFGIEADSLKQAKPRLAHVQSDIISNFRRLGVPAEPLDGEVRLKLMHDIFHLGGGDRFLFDWSWLVPSGLSVSASCPAIKTRLPIHSPAGCRNRG